MIALGGTPNRYAALKRGAVAATLLTPPADFAAISDGMRKLGDTFEAFAGAGVVFVTQRSWASRNADAVRRFLRTASRGAKWLYDPAHKSEACDNLRKQFAMSPANAEESYNLLVGSRIISENINVGADQMQPWLALRGASGPLSRFVDASYVTPAADGP